MVCKQLSRVWPARHSALVRFGAMSHLRMTTRAASSFHSLHEFPKKKNLHVSRAHSSSLVGSPTNASAPSLQPNQATDHGHGEADSLQLELRNLRQSILKFDTQVPVGTDPRIRRWWSRAFIASSFVVLFGFVGAIREFETDRMNLQLALGQLIDHEDYKRLVRNGDVPDSQRWRWYDDNLVLSGDYADRGRWHTLFTHVFLHSEADKLVSAMIMLSLFFRAAWVAGFGKIGTPMVVVGSGVAGGLSFLYTKDPQETAASWGGSSAVTSGLMTAATVARPRMPFFIGFAPAALPIWAVCSLGFLPGLIEWCRDPQKAAQATQEAQARNSMMREQYGQLLAQRAVALGKHHEGQRPITETEPDPPHETRSQDGNEPTHEEEARREEQASSRAGSSRREESRDAEPSGEERLPHEERWFRRDEASSKPESPRKENGGSETAAPREKSPGSEKPTALEEESVNREASPREEVRPHEASPPANDSPAPRPKSIWKDATPHSWLVTESEQPREVKYEIIHPQFGGAACGAVMGLVLRLMLRR
ncbi:hypothetical protein PG996_005219 [Apiospora saccharicola]|uniref:Peptidase S54 rhomboid domain-containing protein n=1 Tax=Apiospora saccharicola TaxID=335842 RepID=A0ABR1VNK3_9PEZI